MKRVWNTRRLLLLVILIFPILLVFIGRAEGSEGAFSRQPAVRQGPEDVIILNPLQDSYVYEGSPGTNYGTNSILLVSRTEFLQETFALLRFNLSGIPVGSVINNASLELYLENGGTSVQTLWAYRVTSTWDSGTVTWNNRPSLGSSYDSTSVGTGSGVFYTWDITSLAAGWHNGTITDYGVALRGPNAANWGKSFTSANGSISANRPRLVIDYSPPTPTPTITPTGTVTPEPTHTSTPTQALGSIGNRVWHDVDHDGNQDVGEPGISGVGMNLISGSTVIDTDVTNGSGNYLFSGLAAGNYTVDIDDWTLPPGYVLTSGTEPRAVTLSAGQNNLDVDFGYAPPPTPTPTATSVPDLEADWLEITQGIQNLHNEVRLVQDKRTFVRFHVHSIGGRFSTTAVLRVTRGGMTQDLRALNPGGEVSVGGITRPLVSRTQLDRAFLFELPSGFREGTVTMTAYLNPTSPILARPRDPIETDYTNNSITETVSFEAVPPLNISIVRVGVNSTGVGYYPSFSHSTALLSWLRRVYPVDRINASFRTMWWGSGTQDAEGRLTNPNCGGVNGRLGSLLPSTSGLRRAIGQVDDRNGFMRGCSGVPSSTSSGPTGTGSYGWDFDGSYGDWYGGHEIGHSLGRPHAPFCDADGSAFYPYPGGLISPGYWPGAGMFESETMTGFDSLDNTIYSRYWTDVMTYCPREWISDYTYEALMDFIQARGRGQQDPAPELVDHLLVMGEIDPSGTSALLETLFILPDSAEIEPRVPGDYAIVLRDGGGAELARYPFTPRTQQSGAPLIPGDPELSFESIFETIPFVAGTDRLDIEGPAGLLTTVTAGSQAPVVNITSPSGGAVLSGNPITIEWTASDGDLDPLEFLVQYSPDNGATWEIVEMPTTNTTIDLNADNIIAGSQARFRVLASDGVHTTAATSDLVTVPNRIPTVSIEAPQSGLVMASDQTLSLEALAIDVDTGTMPDGQVTWSSNLDGVLGSGSSLAVTGLSPGAHTISVEADDGDGGVAVDDVQVLVMADPEDIPTLPDSLVTAPDKLFLAPGRGLDQETLAIDNQDNRNSISWTATASESWVGLSASSGSTPDDLIVSYLDSNLPVGTYSATITISTSDAPGPDHIIEVELVIGTTIFLPVTHR